MTAWQATWEVTRWEFLRFVKPRQLLVSLVVTLLSAGAGIGAVNLFNRGGDEPVSLAVIGGEALGLAAGDTLGGAAGGRRFVVAPHDAAREAALREAVAEREVDALLLVRDENQAELVVRKQPSWRGELEQALSAERQRRRLSTSGLAPQALADMLAPVQLAVVTSDPTADAAGVGELITTGLVLMLAFIALTSGLGFAFAGITGEKQLRVTEQVVSAVPPQRWMDGKILGLAGVALVNTLVTAFAFVILFVLARMFGVTVPIAVSVTDPLLVGTIALVVLLGVMLWFTFICAMAATIDDPNTSTRGSLILLPMLPLAIAGLAFAQPDRGISQFFAIFPLTSWTVLPVRLLLTEVPAWEVALALALLVATILLFRRAAGKVFALGMLMYGKEPTWQELRRWVREA